MHLKRFGLILALSLMGCSVAGFRSPAAIGSGTTTTAAGGALLSASIKQAERPTPPAVVASAGAIVDGDTGKILWGKATHVAFAPASMTKIMTALVALESGGLDRVVVSDVDASTMVGDSVMGLHVGEHLPLRDLLYGLLVPSGDDAALAIARAVAGDDTSFVNAMNAESLRLGLTDTHFVNPHGLDANGHVSSPYDMIVMARAAMRYPFFRQVVATKHITIVGRWTYDLTNTNYFLGRRPDVIGVKTGTTERALHAITLADEVDGHLVYISVMHSPNYVPDASALLDYVRSKYVSKKLSEALSDSPLYANGETSSNGSKRSLSIASSYRPFLTRWEASTLTLEAALTPNSSLRATDNPDLPPANAGAATFYAGGEPIARLPLIAQ